MCLVSIFKLLYWEELLVGQLSFVLSPEQARVVICSIIHCGVQELDACVHPWWIVGSRAPSCAKQFHVNDQLQWTSQFRLLFHRSFGCIRFYTWRLQQSTDQNSTCICISKDLAIDPDCIKNELLWLYTDSSDARLLIPSLVLCVRLTEPLPANRAPNLSLLISHRGELSLSSNSLIAAAAKCSRWVLLSFSSFICYSCGWRAWRCFC